MSHSAKILLFPTASASTKLSPRDAEFAAREFLATPVAERCEENRQLLNSPEVLLSICAHLRQKWDSAPATVESEAAAIYQWISRPDCVLGLFDERDYFLGETALLAGTACRHLGRREEAFLWFDRAEAGFRHTMNPAPGLSNVAYARLAARFEMGRYQDVMELVPSLQVSFKKLRMPVETAKCGLLLAMTLKQLGEHSRAIQVLDSIHSSAGLESEPCLRARLLAELGDLRQLEGEYALALAAFKEGLHLLQGSDTSLAGADLKLYVGGVYRALGSLGEARDAYRAAQTDYAVLGMRHLVAYAHLVLAELLLEMRREREAEWEILAALPAIDEMKMVPEAFAALALLRESVSRRSTNVSALKDVKARLEAAG